MPQPTARMARASAASAIVEGGLPGVGVLRRLMVEGIGYVIENGCGGRMIHAGLTEPVEPGSVPLGA